MTTAPAATSVWFRTFVPRPAARIRLVCFPHAGGAASSFRSWTGLLPPSVELVAVQYPGRQDRFGEEPAADMATMVGEISRALIPLLDRPTAFFGHSMGATVAFETARRLPSPVRPALVRLFTSARRAPADCRPLPPEFQGEEGVLAYVRRLGGAGAAMLDDEELRELALPALRGDFALTGGYRYSPGAPLLCPITSLVGDQDDSNTTADAWRWAAYSTAGHEVQVLPGGHFYTETATAELIALLVDRLGAA
ncbi:thioesterase II family protein [Kitasatospora sp. HPMI-4]|uniref:thioesterase II family protein n=1 Tax=Kitasatospora sp. HPMI-4 TaxID=3448443 RepID=UPI003F1C86E4